MNMPDDDHLLRTPQEWRWAVDKTPEQAGRIVTEADIKKDPVPGMGTVDWSQEAPGLIRDAIREFEAGVGPRICMEPKCSEPSLHSRARCLAHSEEHDKRVSEAARKQVAKDENGGMDLPEGQAETILEEAQRITSQDRNKSYGTPDQNHTLTADFLAVWLGGRYRGQSVLERLDSYDTCVFNLLQKVSRMAHQLRTEGRPQRDTLVDIAGYTQNMAMIDMARFPSKKPPEAP